MERLRVEVQKDDDAGRRSSAPLPVGAELGSAGWHGVAMTAEKQVVSLEKVAGAPPKATLLQLATYWGVVLAWMVAIAIFSSEPFSAANTNRYIDPVLRFFFPDIRRAELLFAHTLIRKTAHFAEFFILGSLLYWACRRGRFPRWRTRWMLQALAIAVLYALSDEIHQAFVPSRTPSLADSGVDSLGAVVSQGLIYVRSLKFMRFGLLR